MNAHKMARSIINYIDGDPYEIAVERVADILAPLLANTVEVQEMSETSSVDRQTPTGAFGVILAWARRWKKSQHLSIEQIADLASELDEPVPAGRTRIEMNSEEYERMRDALGPSWEWRGLVRLRFNGCKEHPDE